MSQQCRVINKFLANRASSIPPIDQKNICHVLPFNKFCKKYDLDITKKILRVSKMFISFLGTKDRKKKNCNGREVISSKKVIIAPFFLGIRTASNGAKTFTIAQMKAKN